MTAVQNGTSAAPRVEAPRGAPRSQSSLARNPTARLEIQPESSALVIGSFEEMVALATEKRDLQVKAALEREVRLVGCEDGRLEIALEPTAAKTLVNELSRKLTAWTGRNWMVVVSREQGAPTLKAQADMHEAELKRGVRADPLVQAVLERFPGAEIVAVRQREGEAAPDAPPEDLPRDEDEPVTMPSLEVRRDQDILLFRDGPVRAFVVHRTTHAVLWESYLR